MNLLVEALASPSMQVQQLAVSVMPASWEVVSLLSQLSLTTFVRDSCDAHENCMHAEQIIIIFYIFFFIFCYKYLVLFSIVLCRTIATVYTDNIFLYNYLRQIHQIIHLSPAGFLPQPEVKPCKKIVR